MLNNLTFPKLFLAIIVVFAIILSVTVSIVQADDDEYDELVQRVKEEMGVSDERAEKFMYEVQNTVHELQEHLTNIASHKTPKDEKRKLVTATIREFFVNGFDSTVQTATIENPLFKRFAAKTYLDRLSKLSDYYDTVEMLFDKSYLSMGSIEKFMDDNRKTAYNFKVTMWQMFKGCNREETSCYTDYTEKGVDFIFKEEMGSWKLRVKVITAKKPIPFREGVWKSAD